MENEMTNQTDSEKLAQALREAMRWNWLDDDARPSETADICDAALAAHERAQQASDVKVPTEIEWLRDELAAAKEELMFLRKAQPASEFASDEDAYESNVAEGIWTAGINVLQSKRWDAKIECHGESKEAAEQLRDFVLATLQAQPASVVDVLYTREEVDEAMGILRRFRSPIHDDCLNQMEAVLIAAAPQPANGEKDVD